MTRTTSSVLANVQAERQMQREMWRDEDKTAEDWDAVMGAWLHKVTTTPERRYVRLVQLAAIAIAAAEATEEERQHE